jgi:hypothetical protein
LKETRYHVGPLAMMELVENPGWSGLELDGSSASWVDDD